jgi:carbonic anhydrase
LDGKAGRTPKPVSNNDTLFGMDKLQQGLTRFHSEVAPQQRKAYRELAKGQSPHTLFITCADSRIMPATILQCDAGEVFVTRNIGNQVPPYGDARTGVAAVVEYAVEALEVNAIVVCGHTDCGAMKALLNRQSLRSLQAVSKWLKGAEKAVSRVSKKYPDLTGKQLLQRVTEENLLLQIEQLREHPAVRRMEKRKKLDLFAWMLELHTGKVSAYHPDQDKFIPIAKGGVAPLPNPFANRRSS